MTTNDHTLEHVRAIMCDTFRRGELAIGRKTTAMDVEEWDSLSHVRLILAVEMAFGVHFSSLEASGLLDVGELVDLVDQKLAQ